MMLCVFAMETPAAPFNCNTSLHMELSNGVFKISQMGGQVGGGGGGVGKLSHPLVYHATM